MGHVLVTVFSWRAVTTCLRSIRPTHTRYYEYVKKLISRLKDVVECVASYHFIPISSSYRDHGNN